MARDFPTIMDFRSAFRFALEAEQAGAEFAAAAGVVAPDDTWSDKLEELVCTHDDRVQKLMAARQNVDGTTLEPLHDLDGATHAAALGVEPAVTWPQAAEQMAAIEDAIADYHEAFVSHSGDVFAAQTRALKKAAEQERSAARELRAMLG